MPHTRGPAAAQRVSATRTVRGAIVLALLAAPAGCRAPEIGKEAGTPAPPVPLPVLQTSASAPSPATPAASPPLPGSAQERPLPAGVLLASAPSAWSAASGSKPPIAPLTCQIRVLALLDAEVFRGVPASPSREAARANLPRSTRERWDGRDHGVTYLRCRYAVLLNGRHFTYDHVAGQGFVSSDPLDFGICRGTAEQQRVEARLVQTTKKCADPHAGAYWGFDLREAPR